MVDASQAPPRVRTLAGYGWRCAVSLDLFRIPIAFQGTTTPAQPLTSFTHCFSSYLLFLMTISKPLLPPPEDLNCRGTAKTLRASAGRGTCAKRLTYPVFSAPLSTPHAHACDSRTSSSYPARPLLISFHPSLQASRGSTHSSPASFPSRRPIGVRQQQHHSTQRSSSCPSTTNLICKHKNGKTVFLLRPPLRSPVERHPSWPCLFRVHRRIARREQHHHTGPGACAGKIEGREGGTERGEGGQCRAGVEEREIDR